jgi:hypothetical protein
MVKDKQIIIRVTEDERASLKTESKKLDLTMSDFIRKQLLNGLPKHTK